MGLMASGETSFIPLPELKERVETIIRTYQYLVPQEVRGSFKIKTNDLEEALKAREFLEGIVDSTVTGFNKRHRTEIQVN